MLEESNDQGEPQIDPNTPDNPQPVIEPNTPDLISMPLPCAP